jgi:hypothetical protein
VLDAQAAARGCGKAQVTVLGILAQAFAVPARVGGGRARERAQRFGQRARAVVAGGGSSPDIDGSGARVRDDGPRALLPFAHRPEFGEFGGRTEARRAVRSGALRSCA